MPPPFNDESKPPALVPSRPLSSATITTDTTIKQIQYTHTMPPDRSQQNNPRKSLHRKGTSLEPPVQEYHDSKPVVRPQNPSPPSEISHATIKPRPYAFSKLDFFRKPKFFSNSSKRHASSPVRNPISHPPDSTPDLYPVMSAPAAVPSPLITSKHLAPSTRPATERKSGGLVLFNHGPSNSQTMHVLTASPTPKTTRSPGPSTHRTTSTSRVVQTHPIPARSAQKTYRRDPHELKNRQGGHRPVEDTFAREERGRSSSREQGTWSPRFPSPKFLANGDRKGKGKENEREERPVPRERIVIAVTHNRDRPRTTEIDSKHDGRKSVNRNMLRNKTTAGDVRTKHGSFDFENPMWVRGSSNNVAQSGYSQSGDSLHSTSPGTKPYESGSSRNHGTPHSSSNSSHVNTSNKLGSLSGPPPVPSSTLGRANSKRTVRATGHTSVPGISHGRFAFEPVVAPPPALSEPSTSNGYNGASKVKRHDSKVSRRGQSLDLRLGLAWAPTKVKEEALMPFGRTISRDSTTQKQDLANRIGTGSDVTDAFSEVLDEAGFAKFKKCSCNMYMHFH